MWRMSKLSHLKVGVLGVSLLAVGAIACVGVSPARAQSTDVDPLEDFRTTDDSSSPFEGSGSNAQGSIFQLIHQMQLRNGGTIEDFNRQRHENIQNQAETFRVLQRQRIESGGEPGDISVEDGANPDL